MGSVKNLHLLTDITDKEIAMIENAGIMHIQFGGIYFTIIEYSPDRVVIKAKQDISPFEVYHTKERLVQIVHETFGRFFTHKEIVVNAIAYKESPVDRVNLKWIKLKMQETGIGLNRIAEDSRIPLTDLEAVISRKQPLTNHLKAFFYFYFESKSVLK